jgi:hypothetical protein
MSDSFRTTPPDQQWSGSNSSNGYQSTFGSVPPGENESENEVGKALLVGLLGGLASAAGYFVYRRLPEDQKERLHSQVRTLVQQRISEIRSNFNI